MSATGATGQTTFDRSYSKDRMMKIALEIWKATILSLKDEQGVVLIRSEEVMDAMALLAGVLLASHEDAKVPSKLRKITEHHARNIAERTRQAMAAPGSPFDVVLPLLEDMH